jgi:hypothetical protein
MDEKQRRLGLKVNSSVIKGISKVIMGLDTKGINERGADMQLDEDEIIL